MTDAPKKTLGGAIDDIIAALSALPEPARLTAVRAACESVGVAIDSPQGRDDMGVFAPPSGSNGDARAPATTIDQAQDIRSLKQAKSPGNNQEMACVMAYYLRNLAPVAERKSVVSAGDVEKYFAQAGYPLPKAPGQVLVDTKGAGYFDAVDRGTYKLNPVGHNLVVHGLPKKGSTVASRAPRPAKKAAPKKAAAKKER